jgi:hypothetical protein
MNFPKINRGRIIIGIISNTKWAMMLVSMVDGLGLEWCTEPKLLSAREAREACFKLLEPILGPLQTR